MDGDAPTVVLGDGGQALLMLFPPDTPAAEGQRPGELPLLRQVRRRSSLMLERQKEKAEAERQQGLKAIEDQREREQLRLHQREVAMRTARGEDVDE